MVRDLHTINTRRLCSGTHSRMRIRTPTSYSRDSERFIRSMPNIRMKEVAKYSGRRPKLKRTLKPRHLTQRHRTFSNLEGRVIRMADAFLPKSFNAVTKPKVYLFKDDYTAPKPSSVYGGNVRPPGEYLGSDVGEEKKKPKSTEEPEKELNIISLDSVMGKGKSHGARESQESEENYQKAA